MAALDYTRPAATGLSVGGRFISPFSNVYASIANWSASRSTQNALERLSDRELEDIGLVRGDIDRISGRMN